MASVSSLVSVIIPAFNRAEFLAEAIDTALGQRKVTLEVIVVDDGSTDGTSKVADRYAGRIHYFYQENSGPPAARNRGIAQAGGEFLAFLDSDDLWPADRTRILLNWLESHPSTEVAMGHLQYISLEMSRSAQFETACAEAPAILNYNLGAALIRAAAMRRTRAFDESLRFSDDWDWFVRAREQAVVLDVLPQVTLINRRHQTNLSNEREIGNHYTLQMLKKALDRRRKEGGL
jgi:glycosyltransferase involved in cell wall biosynthesis